MEQDSQCAWRCRPFALEHMHQDKEIFGYYAHQQVVGGWGAPECLAQAPAVEAGPKRGTQPA